MTVSMKRISAVLLLAICSAAGLMAADAPESKPSSGVVNINTASVEQLAYLPRIGPAAAARIIEYRSSNGGFKKATDLMQVKGIGEKTFEVIRPYLSVEGETTLKDKVPSPKRAKKSRQS